MSIRTKVALVISVSVVVPLIISTIFWVWTLGKTVNEDLAWSSLFSRYETLETANGGHGPGVGGPAGPGHWPSTRSSAS